MCWKHNKVFKSREENTNADCSPKCQICPRILKDSTEQTDITVKDHNACKTWDAVYGIKCEKCNRVMHVRESKRTTAVSLKRTCLDEALMCSHTFVSLNITPFSFK